MPKYAELIYNGFWFTPEREMLQAAIDKSQEFVTGSVRLKLYKGNVAVVGADVALFALRPGPRHLRGRQGRLRPARRRGLHPVERAAAADAGAATKKAQAEEVIRGGPLFPRLARRTQAGDPNREGLRSRQRFRHVDVDIDELDAGLCLAVPRAATPGAFAHLNVRRYDRDRSSAIRPRATAT